MYYILLRIARRKFGFQSTEFDANSGTRKAKSECARATVFCKLRPPIKLQGQGVGSKPRCTRRPSTVAHCPHLNLQERATYVAFTVLMETAAGLAPPQ